MDRPRRRPEPAAIDITWVSCRGVRTSLPFHTPCLYASVCVTSSARKNVHGPRVKTPTDRTGGENPEWDEPLRLYLPDDASEQEAAGNKDRRAADDDGVLVVRFKLNTEVAVLGDVLAASAVVPLSDLVADGRTRRVSYQLAASSDGRQHNGVISFSYAFRDGSNDGDHDEDRRSDGEPVTTPSPVPVASEPSGIYPVIDWSSIEQLTVYPPSMEQIAVYPPPLTADTVTVTRSKYYCASTSPETPVQPAAIYPPLTTEMSARGIYPMGGEPDNGLYPTVNLAPVSCYPPTTTPCYGSGFFRYPAVPDYDTRCLYG